MSESPRVVVDRREMRSGVPSTLRSMGLKVDFKSLSVGDYIIPSGYVIERKAAPDFVNSLFTGRLFDQASRLSKAYDEYLIIVEGDLSSVLDKLPNPRGVWGAMASLIYDYGSRIIFTNSVIETADLLYVLAERGTRGKPVRPLIYRKIRARTSEEIGINVLGNLPGIGPILAERMLTHFGNLNRIFSASAAELSKVEGIGRKKANSIAEVIQAQHSSQTHYASQSKL